MSLQVSAAPVSFHNAKQNIQRKSANYRPSVWADHFLSYASHPATVTDAATQKEYEELKQEVRRRLISRTDTASDKVQLIDAVQRLGVAYHFEKDIENELEKLYQDYGCYDADDLNTVALRFRLLRQEGYNVPCDIFGKFKDGQGKFKSSLINDVLGLLSLYEAAHLGLRGEDILDEAIDFTACHLKSMLTKVSPWLAEEIKHALDTPVRRCYPRFESRHSINVYSGDNPEKKKLLKFAKLDFNMVQSQHQKELCSLTEWWKSLEFATKLPYARNRVAELYFWILAIYFEPQYSLGRRILTKVISMTSVLDDTYDVYGTLEELEIFTNAINRWDISRMDLLPEYMKPLYEAILDVYREIDEEMSKEGRSFTTDYAIEMMKRQVNAYFAEAKWLKQGYPPTMEEYLNVAMVTAGYRLLATTSFLGMGEIANKQAFDWISNDPKSVVASAVFCRLMNDMTSRELEKKREHIPTAVDCYMNEHKVSEEEAIRCLRKEVFIAWKDVNQEFMRPTAVPMRLLDCILNLSRSMDFVYKDGDSYTDPDIMRDRIAFVLVDPLPV